MMSGQDKNIVNDEKLEKINGGTLSDISERKSNNTRSSVRDNDGDGGGRGVKEVPGDLKHKS